MDLAPNEGPPRAPPNEDDWHTVTDAKKRKQIQDRLAQRNRRRRLREAKKNDPATATSKLSHQTTPETGTQIDVYHRENHVAGTATEYDWFNSVVSTRSRPENALFPSSQCLSVGTSPLQQTFTISYEIPYQQTVFSALYMNGEILGLICGILPRQSPPVSANVPPALHPTTTQLLTVHNTGYDRFPFPRMRDNSIIHHELIDDEEFFRDIFTKPCFTIKPGGAPWDPSAWMIEKPFADKWGFLFY